MSLQWNKPGGMSGSNTWSPMLHWFISDGKLPQIMPNHLGLKQRGRPIFYADAFILVPHLDFHLVERLATVNTNHTANHLWNHYHVSQMCFHHSWLFHRWGLFLGFSQPLNESQRLSLQTCRNGWALNRISSCSHFSVTSRKASSRPSVDQSHKLLIAHVQQLVQVDTAIGEFAECPLFLYGRSLLGILDKTRDKKANIER